MGNSVEGVPHKLKSAYNPSMDDWIIRQKTEKVKLWQNRLTGEYLEEYSYVATDKPQLYRLRSHFEHRFNMPFIVATKFFKENQTDELCSTFYEVSMFIEFIGLRLSQFRDVPFPDSLHLYSACLHGFGELQARLSYFEDLGELGRPQPAWAGQDLGQPRLLKREAQTRRSQIRGRTDAQRSHRPGGQQHRCDE